MGISLLKLCIESDDGNVMSTNFTHLDILRRENNAFAPGAPISYHGCGYSGRKEKRSERERWLECGSYEVYREREVGEIAAK